MVDFKLIAVPNPHQKGRRQESRCIQEFLLSEIKKCLIPICISMKGRYLNGIKDF